MDYNIPDYMMKSINEYVQDGKPLGGFLRAVFANDLIKAVTGADEDNYKLLKSYVLYVHWEVPASCHGSYEIVKKWIRKKREEQNENKGND